MAHADPEQLAALALEPDDADDATRAHVATCEECRASVEAMVDVRRLAGADALVPPPPGLRERVLAEALAPAATDGGSPAATPARRRGVPLWAAGLGAAATLVVGVGIGQLLDAGDAEQEPATTVLARTDLTTVEGTDPRGAAQVVQDGDVVTLHVEARELGDDDQLREVWLLNVDGARMVSLGLLPPGEDADFEVPRRLLDEGYRIVDISVEPDDGDPAHSGDSVARGELT